MIKVEVAFLPSLLNSATEKICVAIDALRATVSMTTLLERACEAVVPVRSIEEALITKQQLVARLPQKILLCGEDSIGRLSEGFNLYSSPNQIAKGSYQGSIVVMYSTSGTRLIHSLSKSKLLLVGCALNARTCAELAIKEAEMLNTSVAIVCSGSYGNAKIAIEDVACAGMLLKRMMEQTEIEVCDSGKIALDVFEEDTFEDVFLNSETGQRLRLAGEQEDVKYCSQVDITSVVPAMIRHLDYGDEFVFLRKELTPILG